MSDRLVPLEGVFNFRDFGGYATIDGGRVKRGHLFRSAHLARATSADWDTLRPLKLAVCADLRRRGERDHDTTKWPEGEAPRVIVTDAGEKSSLPPHLQFLKETGSISPEEVRAYMITTYERAPMEERHVELFRDVFAALASAETPLLVHCAAGKDRTGVLCALILDTLGVSRDDVFDDYDLTNRSGVVDGILKQAAARFSKRLERDIEPEQLRPMIGVEEAYLAAAIAAIESEFGTIESYREKVLGVTPQMRERMRAHLVHFAEESV